jgi:5'-nucleotidase
MTRRLILLLLGGLLACWGCLAAEQAAPPLPQAPATVAPPSTPAAPAPPAAPEKVAVTLLHINDTHGHTEPYSENDRSIGGYARLATLVQDVRASRSASPASAKAARVLLIHAGDELSRGDELTRETLGAANVAIWNHLGFDIWVPGNGDYYDGLEVLQCLIRKFKGTVLAANVRIAATGQPLAKPSVIYHVGPVRIAFFGICYLSPSEPTTDLFRVADATATARQLAAELRRQADVVVAVTHHGNIADRRMAADVGGLDLIIGAHSHSVLPKGQRLKGPGGREVLIVQAGESMAYLGRVDLALERADGGWRIAAASASLIPIDDKVKADPAVTALVNKLFDEATPAALAEPAVPAGSQ